MSRLQATGGDLLPFSADRPNWATISREVNAVLTVHRQTSSSSTDACRSLHFSQPLSHGGTKHVTSRTERTSPPGSEILEVLDESRPDALRTRVSRVSHLLRLVCVACERRTLPDVLILAVESSSSGSSCGLFILRRPGLSLIKLILNSQEAITLPFIFSPFFLRCRLISPQSPPQVAILVIEPCCSCCLSCQP